MNDSKEKFFFNLISRRRIYHSVRVFQKKLLRFSKKKIFLIRKESSSGTVKKYKNKSSLLRFSATNSDSSETNSSLVDSRLK